MSIINKAFTFAKDKHFGQKRKGGLPYITHPEAVAKIVSSYLSNENVIAACYLHDCLEDTDTTYEEIEKEFGKVVANLVLELTSDESKIKEIGDKGKYLSDKMNKMSDSALIIKLADRLHNISDFENANPSWIDKYKKQTEYIIKNLRPLTTIQSKIAVEILKILSKY